jgi:hypothetical protein
LLLPSFAPPLDQSLSRALQRFKGSHGTLRLVLSRPLRVAHVIGPVSSASALASPAATRANESSACVVHELSLRGVEAGQGVTVLLELADDVLSEVLFIQAAFSCDLLSSAGRRFTRVVTQRLPVTGNRLAFLDAVLAPQQSLLQAKRLVAIARGRPQPDAVLPDLDRRLAQVLAFAGAAAVPALPAALSLLPRLFFMLRRGPLLSAVLQHEDDIDALRSLFLHAGHNAALRLLQPDLFVCSEEEQEGGGGVLFTPAPLEDLMLQSDLVLLLDRHTDAFVWTGRHVPPARAARLQAAARAKIDADTERFPAPQLQAFSEGSSMARWLVCALVPSHKDPRDAQFAAVPRLASMEPAAYTQLMNKFHHTDDLSFLQYCNQLGELAHK